MKMIQVGPNQRLTVEELQALACSSPHTKKEGVKVTVELVQPPGSPPSLASLSLQDATNHKSASEVAVQVAVAQWLAQSKRQEAAEAFLASLANQTPVEHGYANVDPTALEILSVVAPLSMWVGRARVLSQVSVVDAVASLSLECQGGQSHTEASTTNGSPAEQHQGATASKLALEALLDGSKHKAGEDRMSNTAGSILDVCASHGPARDVLEACTQSLEAQLQHVLATCHPAPNNALNHVQILQLAAINACLAVQSLRDASQTRLQSLDSSSSSSSTASNNSLATIPKNLKEAVTELEMGVRALEQSLQEEVLKACAVLDQKLTDYQQVQAEKEAQKAAKAASAATFDDKKNEEKEKNMSEAQKAKMAKKRAEKEQKAAAKRAAKKKTDESLFGAGITGLLQMFKTNNDSLFEETHLASLEEWVEQQIKIKSGGVQRKPKIPKGTRDYLPDQMMIRNQAFEIIRRVFGRHGAVEIDTPVFELKDTLTGKYGEDSKLIYDLANQGGEILALRYDLTVPFARYLALNSVGNIKRFHIGKVYRRDQPAMARGRYREFYQCDFDIAGHYGRMVPDAECLCVMVEILSSLDIGDFQIKLNHRRLLDAILDLCGVPADKFRTICSAVDKLDKEPWEVVREEMVDVKGLDPKAADAIGEFVLQKGDAWTMYHSLMKSNKFGTHKGAMDALEDLRMCFSYLEAMGKLSYISFDLSLARGLDYYTGIIYEAVCMSGNTQVGSIGGGGRYDNLVSMFQEAGKITPCVGVSVGIERVFTLMEARLMAKQGEGATTLKMKANVDVLVATVGDDMMVHRMGVARLLWDANIKAEFNQQENPKLKYEIASALEQGIPYMVIVGSEEAANGTCKLKSLLDRTEETVVLTDLVRVLKRDKGVVPVGCEFAAELMASEQQDAK